MCCRDGVDISIQVHGCVSFIPLSFCAAASVFGVTPFLLCVFALPMKTIMRRPMSTLNALTLRYCKLHADDTDVHVAHPCGQNECEGADVSIQVHACSHFTSFLLCTLASFMKTLTARSMFTLYFAPTLRYRKVHSHDTLAYVAQLCSRRAMVLMLVFKCIGVIVLPCSCSALWHSP